MKGKSSDLRPGPRAGQVRPQFGIEDDAGDSQVPDLGGTFQLGEV